MKRQIVLSVLIFLLSFIIFIWLMFPYRYMAETALRKTGTNLSWASLSSGPFSTLLTGLEMDGKPIGDVKISYSPLSLITRSVHLSSKGPVTAEAKLSQSDCEFEADINPALVNSLTDKAELSGRLTVKGKASPKEHTASAVIYSDKTGIQTPMGKLDFEKVNANLSVKGDTVTINKLTSQDDMKLNLKGDVRYVRVAPDKSIVNITGSVNLLGSEKEITLKGRMNSLRPSIK